MNKWTTKISGHHDDKFFIRGHSLNKLIEEVSFVDVVFLLLRGDLPIKEERQMLNAILVAISEHGVEPPSTFVARTVASTGNNFNSALAAGVLTIGSRHGGAISAAATYFERVDDPKNIVEEVIASKKRIPGYGHKIYKENDPRVKTLLAKAKLLGLIGKFVDRALAIEVALEKEAGRKIPLNIDGLLAALLLEMKFQTDMSNTIFMLGRLPGLIAHIIEERSEKTYRRINKNDVNYEGPTLEI